MEFSPRPPEDWLQKLPSSIHPVTCHPPLEVLELRPMRLLMPRVPLRALLVPMKDYWKYWF